MLGPLPTNGPVLKLLVAPPMLGGRGWVASGGGPNPIGLALLPDTPYMPGFGWFDIFCVTMSGGKTLSESIEPPGKTPPPTMCCIRIKFGCGRMLPTGLMDGCMAPEVFMD